MSIRAKLWRPATSDWLEVGVVVDVVVYAAVVVDVLVLVDVLVAAVPAFPRVRATD